ncbi:phage major capsid protein [Thermodesulfobacteriota bacterium]
MAMPNTPIEAKQKINLIQNAMDRIKEFADSQGRPMNKSERKLTTDMKQKIQSLWENSAEAPVTMGNNKVIFNQSSAALKITGPTGSYGLVSPAEPKDYRSLFGNDKSMTWEAMGGTKDTGFFSAVLSGRHHPGLRHNIQNTMGETIPSDGGFLVPSEYAERIHSVALEDEIIMPRAFVQPMRTNSIKIPGMNIGDHSSNLMGGFTASYVAEEGSLTEANPKVRQMELQAKKLTGLLRFTSELTEDAPNGEKTIIEICGKGLAWYRDKSFLKGTGAGEPLGILNAPCLVSVAKESGQAADTIVYQNLTKMMAQMYAGSFKNSIWICHQSTIPQLLTLSLAVGTGGDHIPVMTESNGTFSILTRPVIFTEKTEPLGDKGDILMADLTQYVVGLRSGMRFDTSIHANFSTDELLARIIERHDAQPLWDSALTLEDGSTEVSPFVTLAERA